MVDENLLALLNIQHVCKMTDHGVRVCGRQLLPAAIAIGHGACPGTGVTPHQNVVRGIADDKGLLRLDMKPGENKVHRLWIGLGVLHIVGSDNSGEETEDAKVCY